MYSNKQTNNEVSEFRNVPTNFLCIPATNASGERSFSYKKSYLRSTMLDEKLKAIVSFSVNSDLLDAISFNDIIREFAPAKTRKKV